jgi:hypothetical protein
MRMLESDKRFSLFAGAPVTKKECFKELASDGLFSAIFVNFRRHDI